MFFHNETLRKYTLALLSTFNNIEVQYKKSTGDLFSSFVPIKFSSREKATILGDHETSQILSGNYNVLPRASLVFESMLRDSVRGQNKSNKISKVIDGETISFSYNAIPYDYNYSVVIQSRGMNEASMIVEGILSKFNPTYSVRLNEYPLFDEPSTIILNLLDVSFEQEEYSEISTNLVTITISLVLKGHVFGPIQDQALIKKFNILTNYWGGNFQEENEFTRYSLSEWYTNTNQELVSQDLTLFYNTDGQKQQFKPIINDIIVQGTLNVGNTISLTADFINIDNIEKENIFVWLILNGTGTVTTGSKSVSYTSSIPGTTTVQLIITDVHGNQSLPFTKTITLV